jgi:hypothetical protein
MDQGGDPSSYPDIEIGYLRSPEFEQCVGIAQNEE